MSGKIQLATAYVQIIPSMKGAESMITSQLAGVDTGKVGQGLGKGLSSSMAKGMDFTAVGKRLESIGGGITNVGDKLTGYITKPALGAATAVAGITAALGFKRLVGIDTARGQFKGLGHDADAVMKQVDKGVTNTALSMADGASLAVAILATGNLPLQDLEGQLKRVANVSAAYGVDAAQAGYLLNNVLTKNKVTYGDLSQMVRNQIPVISMLADHYGVSGDEIEKMAQQGMISIEDLNMVLDKNAGAAAEEYAKTWKGVTSNIVSNVGRIGAAILGPSFEMAKEQAANFLDVLKTDTVKQFATDLGERLAGALQRATELIRDGINWWKQLDPAVQKNIGKAAAFAVALGPVISITGKVVSGVGVAVGAFGKMQGAISAASGGKGLGALIRTLGRVTGPVGLVVGAIIAMWQNSEAFRTAVMDLGKVLWDALKKVFDAITPLGDVLDPIMGAIGGLAGYLGDVLGGAIQLLIPAIEWLADIISAGLTYAIDALGTAIDWVSGLFSSGSDSAGGLAGAWEWMKNVASSVSDWFTGSFMPAVSGVWDGIMGVAGAVMDWFSAHVAPVFSAVGDLIVAVWERVSANLEIAWAAIQLVWDLILAGWEYLWGMIMVAWETFGPPLMAYMQAAWEAAMVVVETVWNQVKLIFETVWNQIKVVFEAVWNQIKNVIETVLGVIKGIITTVTSLIRGDWQGVWNGIKQIGESIWNGIKNTVSNAINAVKGTITNVLNAIKGTWSNVWNGIKNLATTVWDGIKNTFSSGVGAMRDIFKRMGDAIMNPLKSAFNAIAGFWNNTVGKISFKAPDWVPGFGGKGWSAPTIPMLAEGAVVTAPTLALVGEAGPEAVFPLDKFNDYIKSPEMADGMSRDDFKFFAEYVVDGLTAIAEASGMASDYLSNKRLRNRLGRVAP